MRRQMMTWLVLAVWTGLVLIVAGRAQADPADSGLEWLRSMLISPDAAGLDKWPLQHHDLDPAEFFSDDSPLTRAAQDSVVASVAVGRPRDGAEPGLAITLVEFTHHSWAGQLSSGTDQRLPSTGFGGDEVLVSRAVDEANGLRVVRAQFTRGRVRADVMLVDGNPDEAASWQSLLDALQDLSERQLAAIPDSTDLTERATVSLEFERISQGILWGASTCLLFVTAAGVAHLRERITLPPYAARWVNPPPIPQKTSVVDVSADLYVVRRRHRMRSALALAAIFVAFEAFYFLSPRQLNSTAMLATIALVLALCAVAQHWWYGRSPNQQFRKVRGPRAWILMFIGVLGDMVLLLAGSLMLTTALTGLFYFRGHLDYYLAAVSFLLVAFALFALVGLPGRLAALLGRRDAAALLRGDHRPELLMLRSFADDRLRVRTHRTMRKGVQQLAAPRASEQYEEFCAWVLWRYGPVGAIGRPGERLPPIGAARTYHSDNAWQQVVTNRILAAPLVMVTLGTTGGLQWEMEEIRRLGATGRTLFLVPPTSSGSVDDRVALLEIGLGLPPRSLVARQGEATLLAVAFHDLSGPTCYLTDRYDDLAYMVVLERAAAEIVADFRLEATPPSQGGR